MKQQPLEDVKVVDFTHAAVGTILTRMLADYGATVVHVESGRRVDLMRLARPFRDNIPGINRALVFSNWNCGKYGITLDMNHPRGQEVAKRLIAWADALVENFAPGVMEKWGLRYSDAVNIKPDIIVMRLSNQGQTGPHARHPGYGVQTTALSGFNLVTGWPDREPLSLWNGMYSDIVTSRLGAAVLMAALDHRRRTGEGQLLDVSMLECNINFLAPQILDYYVNGRDLARVGNRCPYAAPHGAYPCRGNDRWCVIAVFGNEEWRGFCKAIGSPQWTRELRFSTLLGRKENEEELDRLVSGWTSRLPAEEVMAILQGAGVAAGVIKNIVDICEDPQLAWRQHFREVDHAEIGLHHCDSWSFKLSKVQSEPRWGGPCLGQDNEYVYTKLLGMSDDEFVSLLSDGVFE
ncbi:MAG: CoA transferase [Dehalococcoidia bacterium]|nr:CoA transferase [Dehalococcoidia bacterium]